MRAALTVLLAWFLSASGPGTTTTEPVITMVRAGCDGVCPEYTVSIFSTGLVEWRGKQSVGTIGNAQAMMSAEQVKALVDSFRRSNFFSFQDSYRFSSILESTADLPKTMLKFSDGGKTKMVEDYDGAPPALRELERLVDRAANTHRWRHDESEALSLDMDEPSYRFTAADDLKNTLVVISDVHSGSKPGLTALMQAAGEGNLASLQQRANGGENVNAHDETGWTALMLASALGQADAVALLLKSGAAVDATDHNGDTALIGVAANPFLYRDAKLQVTIIDALLRAGAKVDTPNNNGETALMWAAKAGNPEVVTLLLNATADPARRDRSGHSAAYYAEGWLAAHPNDIRRPRFENTPVILRTARSDSRTPR